MLKLDDFFSGNDYFLLSGKDRPLMYFPIGGPSLNKKGFCIFRPFRKRSSLLKKALLFYLNYFPLKIIEKSTIGYQRKSDFIKMMEDRLNCNLTTAVYLSNDGDKSVLQLMNHSNEIVGYLKIGLNEKGNERIDTEARGINVLREKKGITIPNILFNETYRHSRLLLLEEIDMRNPILDFDTAIFFMDGLKKNNKFKLTKHPFIIKLMEYLLKIKKTSYLKRLDRMISSTENEYCEVYAHGDFAPWNLSMKQNSLVMIDFEFFEERGLEYLDLIKYYHCVGESIFHYKKKKLYDYTLSQISWLDDHLILYYVFLLYQLYIKIYFYNKKLDYSFEIDSLEMVYYSFQKSRKNGT